jgi:hypothetical protein
VATVATTWCDSKWVYSISPYAGISVSEYRSACSTRLEEVQQMFRSGEVSKDVLIQTLERTRRFLLDDFMRLSTSMLLNIRDMQSLVSCAVA